MTSESPKKPDGNSTNLSDEELKLVAGGETPGVGYRVKCEEFGCTWEQLWYNVQHCEQKYAEHTVATGHTRRRIDQVDNSGHWF